MLILIIITILLRDSYLLHTPFVPTKKRAVPHILKALNMDNKSVCYELGCGSALILRNIRRQFKHAKLIGIEKGVFPLLLARIFSFKKNIKVNYGDMFDIDISKATHIYLYTGTRAMIEFEKKLFNECQNGTRIVSLDFKFPNIKPVEHISLKPNRFSLSSNIYIYDVIK